MKLVKDIVEQINEELDSAKLYIKSASKYKSEYPQIANMYYEMSLTEMTHVDKLHGSVVSLINEMKAKGVEIDPKMMAIYEYEHNKAMEEATEIKVMQEMFKK